MADATIFLGQVGGMGGGLLVVMHGRGRITIDLRIPAMLLTERVGFSPTRRILTCYFGESHEGWATSY